MPHTPYASCCELVCFSEPIFTDGCLCTVPESIPTRRESIGKAGFSGKSDAEN